ncbi:5-formyltetrahydrofolate cyclo-ligase, mitochondrial isoform X1 [Amborella trichopoda]|uniref:5-formyltetrahydrofolate cyclo-ligase, mitochondrial isoform X1 n=1 Tax=Amborella trichopoda TaxID=13333 RepID=UPI0009C11491|nr:5-formyltetrahydrofolate cyclo-ligase, mitochondrial isoform X1 [Amborella trichopoda]|eukprot:XP_006838657.3 5-formyltetrahydrofolate cyclo-ligase, mitochondrial isoform X1 [Amborella trichopoda]
MRGLINERGKAAKRALMTHVIAKAFAGGGLVLAQAGAGAGAGAGRSSNSRVSFSCFGRTTITNTAAPMEKKKEISSLDPIQEEKRALRFKVRRQLKAMSPSQRNLEDAAIQKQVLEASWFKSCKSLCAYVSCEVLREVDTSKILSEILGDPTFACDAQIKKRLYVPRVEDRNCHMRMLNISRVDDLIANPMNILEPAPLDNAGNQREDVMQATHPVDLFLLPGLAFDKSGRRLGRGGGYYDALLTSYKELVARQKWEPPLLVALSYSVQIMDDEVIPVTSHDVLVDALVSPAGVIRISPIAIEKIGRWVCRVERVKGSWFPLWRER